MFDLPPPLPKEPPPIPPWPSLFLFMTFPRILALISYNIPSFPY